MPLASSCSAASGREPFGDIRPTTRFRLDSRLRNPGDFKYTRSCSSTYSSSKGAGRATPYVLPVGMALVTSPFEKQRERTSEASAPRIRDGVLRGKGGVRADLRLVIPAFVGRRTRT